MKPRSPFELIYERHAHAVKAYAQRRSDAATAEEVLAEVFLVCWRRLEDVPADPLPWLLGVARRVLSTQRRSQRRRAALIDRLAQNAPAPADAYAGAQDGALAAALGRAPCHGPRSFCDRCSGRCRRERPRSRRAAVTPRAEEVA